MNNIVSVALNIKNRMMGWAVLKRPAYVAQLAFWYSHLEPAKKWSFFMDGLFKARVYNSRNNNSISKLLSKVKIEWSAEDYFFYSLDVYKSLYYNDFVMDNATIDYSLVLDYSLNELFMKGNDDFSKKNNILVTAIEDYIDRISNILPEISNENLKKSCQYIIEMKDHRAETLEEALQRVLFINQIMWQTRHRLVGLGRLDYILEKYITDEMSDDRILELLTEFCESLHKYFWFKSANLLGDTGQIIILSGVDENGNLIDNRLTKLFMKCVENLQLPDPKILLRVSKQTPDKTWKNAINCMLAQTGSPLFANDEKIIPALINFGYKTADANNYITSACWEPIAGNSFEQNNMFSIDFVKPLCDALLCEDTDKLNDENALIRTYYKYLEKHMEEIYEIIRKIKFSNDILVSSMMKCCRKRKLDITQGGSLYSNIGLLTVGLANAVNGILNIKRKVFEREELTLEEYVSHMKSDFSNEDFLKELKNEEMFFGQDNEVVLELVNRIIDFIGKFWEEKSKDELYSFKFGLSSYGYMDVAKEVMASPDGRKYGQPYSVHISADKGIAPTEIINFAGKLKFPTNGFNGNVIDYFLNPELIRNNKDAFVMLLKTGVEQGFFEMQMNVVDSKTLIAAKECPERFPNLIVRVWGFSAYFNQLPEEYKNYIIERAILSELAG